MRKSRRGGGGRRERGREGGRGGKEWEGTVHLPTFLGQKEVSFVAGLFVNGATAECPIYQSDWCPNKRGSIVKHFT